MTASVAEPGRTAPLGYNGVSVGTAPAPTQGTHMLGDLFLSLLGISLQELAASLAFRLAQTCRVPNTRGLRLLLQLLIFAALVLPLFLLLIAAALFGLHLLSA